MNNEGFVAGPEGGNSTNHTKKRIIDAKSASKKIVSRSVAAIWLGVDGYILYAFCYNIVWHHIKSKNRRAAIAILVIFCWLNFHAMLSFVALHLWGSGEITEKYTERTEPDAAFICDEQGYSLYCSYCKRVKPNRSHHAVDSNKCVPTMDHYCPWVGIVIGQGNLKFFMQYVWSTSMALLVILVVLLIYQHDPVPHINGNSIALYIVTGISFLFVSAVGMQHSLYVMLSQSTLEHMSYRRGRVPYINFPLPNGHRAVVCPNKQDVTLPRASPFHLGFWSNIRRVMGPLWTWPLPIREAIYEPAINMKFVESIYQRSLNSNQKESSSAERAI